MWLKRPSQKSSTEYSKEGESVRVVLPEEAFAVLDWKQDGLPCIGMLNSSLKSFEHKTLFRWHLSVTMDFKELIGNGMPSQKERDIVDPFCDQLDEDIKAGGNALFLIRETWNKTRRLVWFVYDPEIVHQHLQYLVDYQKHPRPFVWRMEEDPTWKKAQWYFEQLR